MWAARFFRLVYALGLTILAQWSPRLAKKCLVTRVWIHRAFPGWTAGATLMIRALLLKCYGTESPVYVPTDGFISGFGIGV